MPNTDSFIPPFQQLKLHIQAQIGYGVWGPAVRQQTYGTAYLVCAIRKEDNELKWQHNDRRKELRRR